jgi:hypothetical protein
VWPPAPWFAWFPRRFLILMTVPFGMLGAAALGRHRVNAVFENTLICIWPMASALRELHC